MHKTMFDLLVYIVLEKKQPVYTKISQKEMIENVLNNTNISVSELEKFLKLSGKDVKSFFNTSGNLYKELHLKDKLPNMTLDEKLELLSTNGMLVKRPVLVGEDIALTGFKEDLWKEVLLNG